MPNNSLMYPVKTEKLTVFSPAKVNLYLTVKGRRKDGFHDLESVFLALDFGDLLHFTLQGDDEIVMENGSVPVSDNIVYKAISLFREKTGFSRRLKVTVEKHIPIGGGLGGGSSNAAATLLALNKMAFSAGITPLSRETLLETACVLGSDVPFFIHETAAATVSGRGEIIEPIEMPPVSLVLINPGFSSDTARAFSLLDEKRNNTKEILRATGSCSNRKTERFRFHSRQNFVNDFLDVFPEREKVIYNEIISQLKEQGAQYANLSGSGASCFGVFEDMEQAQKATQALRGKWDFVECCAKKGD